MSLLRHALSAEVHQPLNQKIVPGDRLWAVAFSVDPQQSALGRTLARDFNEQDVVFAAGEDVGFPLAFALRGRTKKPRVIIEVHNPHGLRPLFAMKYLGLDQTTDLFTVSSDFKAAFLRKDLQFPDAQVHAMNQTTDTSFFTPGPPSSEKKRPLIAAGGLELRDYITLAAATEDMDLDVKISSVSPNVTVRRNTFPKVLPTNMKVDYYGWRALLQLYRDADEVVVPLRPNLVGAGQTSIMEALACARPVVTTMLAQSMIETYAARGFLHAVPPRDPAALRRAIEHILEHPEKAAERARQAREQVVQDFSNEHWLEQMLGLLQPR